LVFIRQGTESNRTGLVFIRQGTESNRTGLVFIPQGIKTNRAGTLTNFLLRKTNLPAKQLNISEFKPERACSRARQSETGSAVCTLYFRQNFAGKNKLKLEL
jgi:hypothetical protein